MLAAQGKIPYRIFVMANVGDDSESPETLDYYENVQKPFAALHGIEMVEVRRGYRKEANSTLYRSVMESRMGVKVPIKLQVGGFGKRGCTTDFKIDVIDKYIRGLGASAEVPFNIGLGITVDELHRMRSSYDSRTPCQRRFYPLIDLRLSRIDAQLIVRDAGLPPAPKSACWFCPFSSRARWQHLHDKHPELWAKAIEMENTIRDRVKDKPFPNVWLNRYGVPLEQIILAGDQMTMEVDESADSCDTGYCMT